MLEGRRSRSSDRITNIFGNGSFLQLKFVRHHHCACYSYSFLSVQTRYQCESHSIGLGCEQYGDSKSLVCGSPLTNGHGDAFAKVSEQYLPLGRFSAMGLQVTGEP